MPDNKIEVGQIYQHARVPKRIRIVAYKQGINRADVVDAVTGKRPRSVLVSDLHASEFTRQGELRRTGYRLVGDSGDGDD